MAGGRRASGTSGSAAVYICFIAILDLISAEMVSSRRDGAEGGGGRGAGRKVRRSRAGINLIDMGGVAIKGVGEFTVSVNRKSSTCFTAS